MIRRHGRTIRIFLKCFCSIDTIYRHSEFYNTLFSLTMTWNMVGRRILNCNSPCYCMHECMHANNGMLHATAFYNSVTISFKYSGSHTIVIDFVHHSTPIELKVQNKTLLKADSRTHQSMAFYSIA